MTLSFFLPSGPVRCLCHCLFLLPGFFECSTVDIYKTFLREVRCAIFNVDWWWWFDFPIHEFLFVLLLTPV